MQPISFNLTYIIIFNWSNKTINIIKSELKCDSTERPLGGSFLTEMH